MKSGRGLKAGFAGMALLLGTAWVSSRMIYPAWKTDERDSGLGLADAKNARPSPLSPADSKLDLDPIRNLSQSRNSSERGLESSVTKPAELVKLIQDNQICNYLSSRPSHFLQELAWKQILQGGVGEDLLGSDGPFQGLPHYNHQNKLVNYFNALLFAGMLEGLRGTSPTDPIYSDQLFSRLEADDPANGEIPYLHSYQAFLAGRSVKEQHDLMLKAVQAKFYRSTMNSVIELFKTSRPDNVTAWYAMVNYLSSIPIPLYPKPEFVKNLLKDDPIEVRARAVRFGETMMNSSENIKIERVYGMAIAKDFWEAAYPHQPKPNVKDPLDRTIAQEHEGVEVVPMPDAEASECDPSAWQKYYEYVRYGQYRF